MAGLISVCELAMAMIGLLPASVRSTPVPWKIDLRTILIGKSLSSKIDELCGFFISDSPHKKKLV